MGDRREFLGMAGSILTAGAGLLVPRWAIAGTTSLGPSGLPPGALEESMIAVLPGKAPLIKRTLRPPNYETPVSALDDMFTPNDKFFVRWHLSVIPDIASEAWRLRIAGASARKPTEIAFADLRRFPVAEVVAVNMCAGNRRGLSQPHVPGVEWGNGAIGNARWRGARLRDVLSHAGIRKDAVEIAFQGQDHGVIPQTPQFAKSLPMWKALDPDTILAYEMNGKPLPAHNGFPVRLIVPGWTGTYWMKQISDINILPQSFDGFWMKSAYRIPIGKFPDLVRFTTQDAPGVATTPVTELVVNSLITNIEEGQTVGLGQPVEVRGIAWDGGHGIAKVEVSTDDGQTWRPAMLGKDYGNYSWRQWRLSFRPARPGHIGVMARATSKKGETQNTTLIWNPAGYHNNVPQRIKLQVA
jgi:DMSO/TMAO reductase YedYZ molybdopterin-dependent catalytic subunit